MSRKKSWKKRGGFNSYGKTALSADFSFKGFEGLLDKIEEAGKSVEDACKKAIDAALPVVEKSMLSGAERHRDTGDVVNAIETLGARSQGDYIYGKVGINLDKHPEAFEAVFQEYGDGHSPEFPDPFVRPATENNKKEIRSIIRKTLKKEGVL